jgi:hypothetical protein
MPIKTPEQYYEGLRDGRVVYLGGKKIKDDGEVPWRKRRYSPREQD